MKTCLSHDWFYDVFLGEMLVATDWPMADLLSVGPPDRILRRLSDRQLNPLTYKLMDCLAS